MKNNDIKSKSNNLIDRQLKKQCHIYVSKKKPLDSKEDINKKLYIITTMIVITTNISILQIKLCHQLKMKLKLTIILWRIKEKIIPQTNYSHTNFKPKITMLISTINRVTRIIIMKTKTMHRAIVYHIVTRKETITIILWF